MFRGGRVAEWIRTVTKIGNTRIQHCLFGSPDYFKKRIDQIVCEILNPDGLVT